MSRDAQQKFSAAAPLYFVVGDSEKNFVVLSFATSIAGARTALDGGKGLTFHAFSYHITAFFAPCRGGGMVLRFW